MTPDKKIDLAARIEAFLFSEGGTLGRKKLSQLLEIKPDELTSGLNDLSERLASRGIILIQTDTEVALALSPETSQEVSAAYEREIGEEIGDAGLEVVAIVLYRGPSTRAQIDYIRGVNSSSTMRTLLSRGLLERIGNPDDAREYLYRPTVELLAHLGVGKLQELPDYDKISNELKRFEEAAEPKTSHGNPTDLTDNGRGAQN